MNLCYVSLLLKEAVNIQVLWLVLTVKTLIYSQRSSNRLTRFSCHFSVTSLYDYVFPENGLVAYKNGELIATQVCLSKAIFLIDILNDCGHYTHP